MSESNKSTLQRNGILTVIVFFAIVFAIAWYMSWKNVCNIREMLESSIKSQVISTSIAARAMIDLERFESYDTVADTEKDAEAYKKTLEQLRLLQKNTGSKYIYAIKPLNGKYYFVFDTDPTDEKILEDNGPYKLDAVHKQAFLGKNAAAMDVEDEFGRYHTGAVPIWKKGKVVGIVCTDVDNTLWDESRRSSKSNSFLMIGTIAVAMCAMLLITSTLLRRLQTAQDKLFQMANYDPITGLPNRRYLLNYLMSISSKKNTAKEPFALLFIDVDNFKNVNDGAGHDAGDELLQRIAGYLDSVHKNSRAFHPSAGILNVSARIGGDEFIQIVHGVATEAEAAAIARKILENFLSKAGDRLVEKYNIGLSIGVALYPYHSDNYNVLIKYADIAMYYAKRTGKNTYGIYSDELKSLLRKDDLTREISDIDQP